MKKKRIYFVLLCLILCFIWGNSLLSREISGEISHFIAEFLGGGHGTSDEGHRFVRKAAHFCEFASLGAVFLLWIREITRQRGMLLLACAFMGVSVPLIDETIQIFSGRGPALSDVWLDISGYVEGSAICTSVIFLIFRRRKT